MVIHLMTFNSYDEPSKIVIHYTGLYVFAEE